jgi:DNA-directed RNA polymerase specialized sigma24 family protein
MPDEQRSLKDLTVDEEKVSEELLYDLLSRYIRIGEQSGRLFPEEEFQELSSGRKVVVVLLTQKARSELDMVETEWMAPSEISEDSGIKTGTVHPKVRELEQDGVIESDGDGSYRVPTPNMGRAREYILGGEDNE